MTDTATVEAPVADETTSTKPIFKRHANGVHVAVFRNVNDNGQDLQLQYTSPLYGGCKKPSQIFQ